MITNLFDTSSNNPSLNIEVSFTDSEMSEMTHTAEQSVKRSVTFSMISKSLIELALQSPGFSNTIAAFEEYRHHYIPASEYDKVINEFPGASLLPTENLSGDLMYVVSNAPASIADVADAIAYLHVCSEDDSTLEDAAVKGQVYLLMADKTKLELEKLCIEHSSEDYDLIRSLALKFGMKPSDKDMNTIKLNHPGIETSNGSLRYPRPTLDRLTKALTDIYLSE